MNLYVGTSGYAYKEWKAKFYPSDLPQKEMLRFYAQRFRTVEINNTFYRMPRESVLEQWASEVPEDFKFVLKASQRITHVQRLKDADGSVAYLFRMVGALEHKLGPVLFQTPPEFRMDLDRLRHFMDVLPPQAPVAFEFRHQSWFASEVFQVLREHKAALCIAQADNDLEVPLVSTADWGYLRLRRPDYVDSDLVEWIDRVRGQHWHSAYIFFKHEDEGKGPEMARRFLDLYGERIDRDTRERRLAA